jgi:hypothetical protein
MKGDEYEATVKQLAKDAKRGGREHTVERAFGNKAMPSILRSLLDETGGAKRPALRKVNDRLREADWYDHEEKGVVSPNTFYAWLDRYGEALGDVV